VHRRRSRRGSRHRRDGGLDHGGAQPGDVTASGAGTAQYDGSRGPRTTAPVATLAATTAPPRTARHVVPVADVAAAGWGTTHSAYPATDIFVGCGATAVSPVDGTVSEVRRADAWDEAVDNPATRGGRSLTIVGDDGVRYYLAHFETILDRWAPGTRIAAGDPLGEMGATGRASACHLHFAISPPCPGKEWSVRRGVIWPFPYLDAWRAGDAISPADEVEAWAAANPEACAEAMADPDAGDS
jgi:murein DD-endopeptidase MepM/ murein hydrolase activator NlpD